MADLVTGPELRTVRVVVVRITMASRRPELVRADLRREKEKAAGAPAASSAGGGSISAADQAGLP